MAIKVITTEMIHALDRAKNRASRQVFSVRHRSGLVTWVRPAGQSTWRRLTARPDTSTIRNTGPMTTDQVVAAVQAYKAAGWHPVETPVVLR